MAIKIGHASIDENGKSRNGNAGDSTGKEVCIREWYSKSWEYVLRCKDIQKAELMALACLAGCQNENIGYDQNQRNTLNTQAKLVHYDLSQIQIPCETDCSAFMTVCAWSSGIQVPYNGTNAPTTYTMETAFGQTGYFDILRDPKYLTSDLYLKRGDILVKPGSHTVMVLENGIYSSHSPLIISECPIGIDVSAYQGEIEWEKVKKSNIKFVILRGLIKSGAMDTSFERNYKGCIDNKIDLYGVYQYSYALDTSTAVENAKAMVTALKGKKLDIWLDLEYPKQGALGKEAVTAIAKSYIETCHSLGYQCHIYSNYDWYKNKYHPNDLFSLGCKLWIARYPSNDIGAIKDSLLLNIGESIWQYSSKGRVPGINGNVDMNLLIKPLDALPLFPLTGIIANCTALNVRNAPVNGSIITALPAGTKLTILDSDGNWYKIRHNDTEGWSSKKYIKI